MEHCNCCLAISFNLIYSFQDSPFARVVFFWGELKFFVCHMEEDCLSGDYNCNILCCACAPAFQRGDSWPGVIFCCLNLVNPYADVC